MINGGITFDAACIVVVNANDIVAFAVQSHAKVRADKSSSACDKNIFHLIPAKKIMIINIILLGFCQVYLVCFSGIKPITEKGL